MLYVYTSDLKDRSISHSYFNHLMQTKVGKNVKNCVDEIHL